jgi:hypothetical protein
MEICGLILFHRYELMFGWMLYCDGKLLHCDEKLWWKVLLLCIYVRMFVLNMWLCGLVMCEYVVVWTCSGYGRLGPECWQHLGCSFSRARTSGATPVLVVRRSDATKSCHKLGLHRNPRPSCATNSVYTAIRGITKMEQQHYKDMKQYVALPKWNNSITKTWSITWHVKQCT